MVRASRQWRSHVILYVNGTRSDTSLQLDWPASILSSCRKNAHGKHYGGPAGRLRRRASRATPMPACSVAGTLRKRASHPGRARRRAENSIICGGVQPCIAYVLFVISKLDPRCAASNRSCDSPPQQACRIALLAPTLAAVRNPSAHGASTSASSAIRTYSPYRICRK